MTALARLLPLCKLLDISAIHGYGLSQEYVNFICTSYTQDRYTIREGWAYNQIEDMYEQIIVCV